MNFLPIRKLQAEYRIMVHEGRVKVEHVTCTLEPKSVIEWPVDFAGGMSVDTIVENIERHALEFHRVIGTDPF